MFALCFGIGAFCLCTKFYSAVDVFVFVFMFTSSNISCSFAHTSRIEIHILHHNNYTVSITKKKMFECHMQWLKWHWHCRCRCFAANATGKTKLFCIYCVSAGTVVACHCYCYCCNFIQLKSLTCRWINSQHKTFSTQMLMFIITSSFVYVHSTQFLSPPTTKIPSKWWKLKTVARVELSTTFA